MIQTLLVLALLGQTPPSADAPKLPWLWTTDERIARRVDPDARHARLVRELPSIRQVAPGWSPINGAYEPELFLPGELLGQLLRAVDQENPHAIQYREHYLPYITRAGWNPELFWRAVQTSSTTYIALRRTAAEAQRASRGHADLTQMQIQLCTAKADVLTSARNTFGAVAFDQFLYSAVAPNLHFWVDDRQETSDTLIKADRGCK